MEQVDQNPAKSTIQVQDIYNNQLTMTEFTRGLHSADEFIDVFFRHAATEAFEEKQMGEKQRMNLLEDHPCPPSPLYPNFEELIEQIGSSPDFICNDSLFSGPNIEESHPLFPTTPEPPTAIGFPELKDSESQRREKNSNAIKKIGRIILDNLRQYGTGRANSAVAVMLRLLSKDSKVGRTEVNKRDKFNTYHLRALLGGQDLSVIRANLRTTRRILSRHIRKNVLLSRQITNPNKALYLNTMKCSALRCLHQSLAVRLQMSL